MTLRVLMYLELLKILMVGRCCNNKKVGANCITSTLEEALIKTVFPHYNLPLHYHLHIHA